MHPLRVLCQWPGLPWLLLAQSLWIETNFYEFEVECWQFYNQFPPVLVVNQYHSMHLGQQMYE